MYEERHHPVKNYLDVISTRSTNWTNSTCFYSGQVTIGRNPDVTVCILSTMISRCHAILKKKKSGEWTIKDNKVMYIHWCNLLDAS